MTRQEMYNLIVKNKWANEVLTMYGRSYSSCSNDILAAFIAEKGKATVTDAKDDKKAQAKQAETKQNTQDKVEKVKPKTQEEILNEVLARVNNYKASTEELRKNTGKLEEYTDLLKNVKEADAFLVSTSKNYPAIENPNDKGKYLIAESGIRLKFDDTEFVRELLICFITERINKLMDEINKNQKEINEA